jgi:hypothetical protein
MTKFKPLSKKPYPLTAGELRSTMFIDELNNLLLNIHGGLDKDSLSDHEKELLEKEYGENWEEKVFGKPKSNGS